MAFPNSSYSLTLNSRQTTPSPSHLLKQQQTIDDPVVEERRRIVIEERKTSPKSKPPHPFRATLLTFLHALSIPGFSILYTHLTSSICRNNPWIECCYRVLVEIGYVVETLKSLASQSSNLFKTTIQLSDNKRRLQRATRDLAFSRTWRRQLGIKSGKALLENET